MFITIAYEILKKQKKYGKFELTVFYSFDQKKTVLYPLRDEHSEGLDYSSCITVKLLEPNINFEFV